MEPFSRRLLSWIRLFCTYTLFHLLITSSNIVNSQYIVQTELSADYSSLYCQWHCGSNLSSIDSETMFTQIQSLSDNDPGGGIWIGMKADPHPDYKWLDGSTLTFGGDFSGGAIPWSAGEPSGTGTQCVAMSTGFEWIATSCDTARKSLCGHCNGVINKYKLLYLNVEDVGYSFTQAQKACTSTISSQSTLASIHSDRDWLEATSLCSISGSDCWIGLNDRNLEGVYSYTDGTAFDYGTITEDLLSSTTADTDCVHLSSGNGYVFEDTYCSGTYSVNYALCHLPSELCEVNAAWTKSTGNVDGDCVKSLTEETLTFITDKLWYNGPSSLVIEYTYSFTTTDPVDDADSGIVIYNGIEGSTCRWYYIYVRKEIASSSSWSIGLIHYDGGSSSTLLSSTAIAFQEDRAYTLSVHVASTGNVFEIYLNDALYITYDHSSNGYTRRDGFSGFIGIKTSLYTQTTVRSLYISGTAWSQSTALSIIPSSSCPTNEPTASTRSPSRAPTTIPTLSTPPPTGRPSMVPTPSPVVTANPTQSPSQIPSTSPSRFPSKAPSTKRPTGFPTQRPTYEPTPKPSTMPTRFPSISPSRSPSLLPSQSPSQIPSQTPSAVPTQSPSRFPSKHPTDIPSSYPTTSSPTLHPSTAPTVPPTPSPTTSSPTTAPSMEPSMPSRAPSRIPSLSPSLIPTNAPSPFPTASPSNVPTSIPSVVPTASPTKSPSKAPTAQVRIAEIIEYDTAVIVSGNTVSMTVTFEYRFMAMDVAAIELILEESVHELVKADCGYTKGLQFDHRYSTSSTRFNASIATCDVSSSSRLLSSMEDESLQSKWMQRILQDTKIQIVKGQTGIDYGTTTEPETVHNVIHGQIAGAVQDELFEDDSWTSWLVRILLLQVLLCCVLVGCVCTLRLKTKSLVKKTQSVREEIEHQIESSENGGEPLSEGDLQASVNPIFNGVPPGSPVYHFVNGGGGNGGGGGGGHIHHTTNHSHNHQTFHIMRPPMSAQTMPHTQSPQLRAQQMRHNINGNGNGSNTTNVLQRAMSQPVKERGGGGGGSSSDIDVAPRLYAVHENEQRRNMYLWKQMKNMGKSRRSGNNSKYRHSNNHNNHNSKMVEMMHHFGDIPNSKRFSHTNLFGSHYHQAVSTEDLHVSMDHRDRGDVFRRIRTDNSYPSIPDTQTIVSSFKYIKPSRNATLDTPDTSMTLNTDIVDTEDDDEEEKKEPIPSTSPPMTDERGMIGSPGTPGTHGMETDAFHTAAILAHRMPAFTDSYNPSRTYNLMPTKSVSPSPITVPEPSPSKQSKLLNPSRESSPSATSQSSGSSTPRESTILSTRSEVTTAMTRSEVTTALSGSPTPIIVYRKSQPDSPRSQYKEHGVKCKAKRILTVTPRISRSTAPPKSETTKSIGRRTSMMEEVQKSEHMEFNAENDEKEPLKM